MIPFVKGHGLGNDYLVIDAADVPGGTLSERGIVHICDRDRGVGSDGILLLVPTSRADFGLCIFNPDGARRSTVRQRSTGVDPATPRSMITKRLSLLQRGRSLMGRKVTEGTDRRQRAGRGALTSSTGQWAHAGAIRGFGQRVARRSQRGS